MCRKLVLIILLVVPFSFIRCNNDTDERVEVLINATSYNDAKGYFQCGNTKHEEQFTTAEEAGNWLTYNIEIPVAGRYKCEFEVQSSVDNANCWLEDYHDNADERTYNVTGIIPVPKSDSAKFILVSVDGSPLNKGMHKMKFHFENSGFSLMNLKFTLLKEHQLTPEILTQQMEGKNWELVWSDEFNGNGLISDDNWTYDIGNWGWGNYEAQYYTEQSISNARQKDGNLIITAKKDQETGDWTSARLTTRGKVSFLYGKIEIRAKVPKGNGMWTAAWLLGDNYRDEISWPYCGEVDIIECTGHEIDDKTGNGKNHMSFHTGAYYFKKGNQVKNIVDLEKMDTEYHTYTIEWYPEQINAYVDGNKWCTYDKTGSELEWPFDKPQNMILNIAVGGFMGGEIDPQLDTQEFIIDYVRVSELGK